MSQYTQVGDNNSGDGTMVVNSATNKLGFYGATPVVRRSGAAQATSNLSTASSTAIDTQTKAALIEVMNTLAALGLWNGA